MIPFVGAISLVDADVLACHARKSNDILEFGIGGSTMVIAQNKPVHASFVTVDTNKEWIDRISECLKQLGVRDEVTVTRYEDIFSEDNRLMDMPFRTRRFDMIFVDGQPEKRESFFNETFGLLRVGGVMLVHDTRWKGNVNWILKSCTDRWTEISRIDLNTEHSNMTAIYKCMHGPYLDWNVAEGRLGWESGIDPPIDGWIEKQVEKYNAQREDRKC